MQDTPEGEVTVVNYLLGKTAWQENESLLQMQYPEI